MNSNSNFKINEGSSISLDLIRGISAQVVVIGHGILYFDIFQDFHHPRMQNIAVLVFFILSGFLITYSTLSKSNYYFKQFFIDRFSRIYSAFIPALILVFAIDYIHIHLDNTSYVNHDAYNFKTFVGNIFMLQDYPLLKNYHLTSFGSARPFWTLAIEWWIYLLFGFVVLDFSKKVKKNYIDYIVLLGLAIVPTYNLLLGRGNGLTLYWLMGASIFAILKYQLLKPYSKKDKLVALLLLILFSIVRIRLTNEEYEPIFSLFLSGAILLIIDLSKSLNFSRLATILIKKNAEFSYTLYLIHYSIINVIFSFFADTYDPYFLFGLSFLLSNVISLIIAYYSEVKLTRYVKSTLYEKYNIQRNKI